MRLAIFTLGIDTIRLAKMEEYANKNWKYAGRYSEENRLVTDAKRNFFNIVLVIDYDAMSKNTLEQLREAGVEVIGFFDQGKLELRLRAEKEKAKKLDEKEKELVEKTKFIDNLQIKKSRFTDDIPAKKK